MTKPDFRAELAHLLPGLEMHQIQRVLITKLSAMGDILHALPVSAALGKAFPHLEISWACEEMFEPLLSGNPFLSNIITLPKLKIKSLKSSNYRSEYLRYLKDIRSRKFDLAIDLQGLTKSALISLASGAKYKIGYHWLREAAPFIEKAIPKRLESVHIVDQYLDVARFLGADVSHVEFPFTISEEDSEVAGKLLEAGGIDPEKAFVVINPAAGHPLKEWGAENYAELIDRLWTEYQLPTALVTADLQAAAAVERRTHVPFVNLAGKTSLKQLGAVLMKSVVQICGDTGSAHMSAALNRPVITLIGPTDPDRACPYNQRANVISGRSRCGKKCDWHHCEYAIPKCLSEIEVGDAVRKVNGILNNRNGTLPGY